jgi:hypothetical protein
VLGKAAWDAFFCFLGEALGSGIYNDPLKPQLVNNRTVIKARVVRIIGIEPIKDNILA